MTLAPIECCFFHSISFILLMSASNASKLSSQNTREEEETVSGQVNLILFAKNIPRQSHVFAFHFCKRQKGSVFVALIFI